METRKIQCLIVDDEPLARKVIAAHLKHVDDIEIVASCSSAIEAYALVQRQPIDLVFLDIQMPELTGIEFMNALEHPPRVIFTTAHRNYALEGFELDVVDYLLKPISLPRFLKALDKFRRLQDAPNTLQSGQGTETDYISIRANRKTIRLPIRDILFVESLSDYVQIHTASQVLLSKERISHLADKLSPFGFLRIHRSFLVSVNHITSFSGDEVFLGERSLPISRSYKHIVRQQLN